MKRWKRNVLVASGVVGAGVLGVYLYMQGLGDLRTDYAKTHGASASAQQKGRALLAGSLAKLGGADRWRQLREQALRISSSENWRGMNSVMIAVSSRSCSASSSRPASS